MKHLFSQLGTTNPRNAAPLIIRLAYGIVMFPHGAQLLLGWFGGGGYAASIAFFASLGIPSFVGFLVIFLEFFGSIFIFSGLLTRWFSVASVFLVTGMILIVHIHVGFFMNWNGTIKGEGFEYHILMISMLLSLVVTGGGKGSLDAYIFKNQSFN